MKRFYALILFAALISASCDPEPIHPVDVVDAPDFIAVIDDAESSRSWDTTDQILVVGGGSATYTVKTAGVRSDLVKAGGEAPSGPFTAYYPADMLEHPNIPAVCGYPSEIPANTPMVAVSDNRILPFRSILGTLAVTLISDEEIVVNRVVISANQPLSGDYEVVGGKAVLSGSGNVTVECADGIMLNGAGAPLYLELPAGRYDGLKMSIVDNLGRERVLDLGAMPFTIQCARITGYTVNLASTHQKRAVLPSGPEFNMTIKTIANGAEVDSVKFQDRRIRSIVLDVNSAVDTGTMIQSRDSDYPVYASYNRTTGAFTISTAASELYTVKDASSMFRCLTRLSTIINMTALNVEDSEDMRAMFAQDGATSQSLDNLDFSRFNTSNVKHMDSMFFFAKQLTTLDLTSMDTRNCRSFSHFLDQASKLKKVSVKGSFTACSASDVSYMFYGCSALVDLDLSTFDTGSAESMSHMFTGCTSLKNLDPGGLNTSKVTYMDSMFYDCKNLQALDLKNFDTTRVEDMKSMFHNCNALKSLDVTSFATSNVFDMTSMFRNCYVLEELDLSSFNLTIVNPSADYMFCQLRALKTLRLGDSFILINGPQYFACSSLDARSTRTSSVPGRLTIVCNQTIADWISITTFRWLNSGYSGAGAIPITFQDEDTGEELKVKWAND